MKSVLIIGGGIVGQFSAYYLSKSGYQVTIVDDQPAMSPASTGNCGLITPSHIEPLNSLSMILEGIKSLGQRDAPLYIKPQFNRSFIQWFISFLWNSRSKHFERATETRNTLLQESWTLYSEFFKNENTSSEWKTEGLVYVCKHPKSLRKLSKEVSVLQKHQLKSELLSKEELHKLIPSLKDDIVGGAIFHVDGWLDPTQLLQDITSINQSNGVKMVSGHIQSLAKDTSGIERAETSQGSLQADQYVLCAGAQSVELAKQIGISLPIIPGKGYNLTTSKPLKNQPEYPVYMYERKVVATPWESGFRLGSTMEFTGYDLSLNQARLDALVRASNEYLDLQLDEEQMEPWAGWRPMSSTGTPTIERSRKFKNLVIATGHGMLGLSMAPGTGKLVTEIMNHE